MSLNCHCDSEYDFYFDEPEWFEPLATKRRKRCASCRALLNIGQEVLKFECYRYPLTDIEEKIYGECGEIQMASKYHCEKCGEVFLNLAAYGYCVDPTVNMDELLREHWEYTGFEPGI